MSVLSALKKLLAEIATLQKPVTATAVVAVIVELIPSLHINGTAVAGILVGVGVVAGFVENLFDTSSPAPVPRTPTPVVSHPVEPAVEEKKAPTVQDKPKSTRPAGRPKGTSSKTTRSRGKAK